MGELWRDLVELLRRRPMLWIPVLIADLIGFFITFGRDSLVRLLILRATVQHSVLGGGVVHGPLSASAVQSTTVIALLLTWFGYLLRTLLYSAALVSMAALIQAFRHREPKPLGTVPPRLAVQWGGILELALRALAVYAIAALLIGWISPALVRHGHTTLIRNPWFGYSMSLLLLVVLSLLLPPVVLRILSGHHPKPAVAHLAQQFSLILAGVDAVLAGLVNANGRELAQVPMGARLPLQLIGSFVVALPYVLLFTGLVLLAHRVTAAADISQRD